MQAQIVRPKCRFIQSIFRSISVTKNIARRAYRECKTVRAAGQRAQVLHSPGCGPKERMYMSLIRFCVRVSNHLTGVVDPVGKTRSAQISKILDASCPRPEKG